MIAIIWEAVVVGGLLLVGVPSNAAIIWIHTRKDSRLRRNKFPLMFAVFDLIAIILALPLLLFIIRYRTLSGDLQIYVTEAFNFVMLFAMNGYLMTLLVATADKFYAVTYPFKYGVKQQMFVKIGKHVVFGFNFGLVCTTTLLRHVTSYQALIYTLYSALIALVFVTTIILYVTIVTKLLQNGRKMRKVGANA